MLKKVRRFVNPRTLRASILIHFTRLALIRAMDELEEYEVMSCVRVYHIYQLIWAGCIQWGNASMQK